MSMEVSIIIVAYNEETYIEKCLTAILKQTFCDFELIVIDDGSGDQTASVIKPIRDERIRYIRNDRNYGLGESRNLGLKVAKGEYIFFTDADCIPSKYWIEEGLKHFKDKRCIGVTGRTFYATAKTTIADRIIENLEGHYHYTNNVAYKKEIIDKVGGFNEEFKFAYEDQDMGYQLKEYGQIVFSEDMIVVHQRKVYTVSRLFQDAKRAENAVYFIKKYRDYCNFDIKWKRILYPKKLLILLFPPWLIVYHSFRSWQDFKLLPFVYLDAIYIRFIIWKTAIKEKIFLI